jgi:hypothetical protein
MITNKKEPTDPESLWLKFWKLAPSIIGFGHLVVDVVELFIDKVK